ncbi:unnamed protein product [Closterium sp. NIES-54]
MLSSTESEYVAATEAGKEGRGLRFLLAEFRQLDAGTPTVLRMDNKSAITVAEGMGLIGNLKHMERRQACLQHMLKRGKFSLSALGRRGRRRQRPAAVGAMPSCMAGAVTGVLCVGCTPTSYSPRTTAVWAEGPSVNVAGECQWELGVALSSLGRCRPCGQVYGGVQPTCSSGQAGRRGWSTCAGATALVPTSGCRLWGGRPSGRRRRGRHRPRQEVVEQHVAELKGTDFGTSAWQRRPGEADVGGRLIAPPSDESVEPSGLYPEFVGCLMYLMTCTRPDLAYPLSILACYIAPGRHRPEHWEAAKRVLCYLCSTSGMGLVLGGRGPVVLTGHADNSWVATSSQVFAAASKSSPASAPCSCRPLAHETLLWHHRLGHPSLPRLRGMASRALVSGLPRSLPPLPPGPAPTCVPCVEGRQCAAPHSSSFPPIEAPLQTLHMDQNGIAERRIGMVMDVAHTSMIHAAAPHFLWPFAVQYAAHQINLQPRVSLPETTPTLQWTGKVGDASAFRVWESQAFVRDTTADKLSSRAVPCVFLGFPPDAPGWQIYHPTSRRVLSSQDVTFDESVSYYRLFPYRTASPPPPRRSSSHQVDPAEPVEVAVDSGAARGAEPAGAGTWGAETRGAESGGAEFGRAEPGGAEPGRVEPEGVVSGASLSTAAS